MEEKTDENWLNQVNVEDGHEMEVVMVVCGVLVSINAINVVDQHGTVADPRFHFWGINRLTIRGATE